MFARDRSAKIGYMRSRLGRDGFPRLEMFVLVSITGAAAFAASYFLLSAGVTTMC